MCFCVYAKSRVNDSVALCNFAVFYEDFECKHFMHRGHLPWVIEMCSESANTSELFWYRTREINMSVHTESVQVLYMTPSFGF